MLKLIEKNYFKINLAFILIVAVYCMCGLIVPLQFISANKIVAGGMTLFGIILATYNLFIKKVYLKVKTIEYLLLFFAFNIITSCLVISYGTSANIKNSMIFIIYFFSIFPMFSMVTKEQAERILKTLFCSLGGINTIAVIISLLQFLFLKGYRVLDYRGIWKRQGFMESRLFGVFIDPNILSVLSLIIIVFIFIKLKEIDGKFSTLKYFVIIVDYIYIVLAGSRTALIILVAITILYMLIIQRDKKSFTKTILKIGISVILVLVSYRSVEIISNQYLSLNKELLVKNQEEERKGGKFSLERDDTSSENISNNRFQIWKSVASFIPEKPVFGYSSGNWYEVGKELKPDEYIIKEKYLTHNGYLELLFYNGIVGFITMAIFIIIFLRNVLLNIIDRNNINKNSCTFTFLVLVIICIANMFLSSTFYGVNVLGVILFSLIGYYYSIMRDNIDERK